jgi:hypothetical protein
MNDRPSEHDWKVVADFADMIQHGKDAANASEFNTTAYKIQRPYTWNAPATPP